MEMTLKHQRYQPGRHFLPEIQNDNLYLKKSGLRIHGPKSWPARTARSVKNFKQTDRADRRSREFFDQRNGPFRTEQNFTAIRGCLIQTTAVKKFRGTVQDGNQTVPRSLKRMHQKRVN